ncbi:MAG: hypothetical protein U1B30_16490 [Pseudomonadota bacterium]|nr:hypothetical protein [Pseudomonadota bacterium]
MTKLWQIIKAIYRLGLDDSWRRLTEDAEFDPEFIQRVTTLCYEQDSKSAPGTSGEYKRHSVYAQLIKEYPGRRKRDLSRAIDYVLR